MSRFFSSALSTLRAPAWCELLAWCLPALLVGVALRIALCVVMPYAYFHDDASDFLTTPDRLIYEHKFELHEKKTFLVPVLFTAPFALPIPALVSIPILQHIVGLALVVAVGALCRLWFRWWKVFIIPLTLLAAINPFLLWYEHTIMAETTFVFCTVLIAIAGTLYSIKPNVQRFVFLCVALVLESGARPEGKLLFGFGLLLIVIVHWGELRASWMRPAILVAIALLTHVATRTSQAGLLLYTSVARLTPTELSCAPGLDPYIAPIRSSLQARWDERPQFPRVRDRKAISEAVERYLKDDAARGKVKRQSDVNKFCLKLAKETCLRNIAALPGLALIKFKLVANESPAALFDNAMLFDKQREAYLDNLPRTLRLSQGLVGSTWVADSEVNHFVDTNYGEVPWFNKLSDTWLKIVNAVRFPDKSYPNAILPAVPYVHYGIPLYFLVGGLGVLAAMMIGRDLRGFHIAWGLTILGFFFVIMLTANVRPRFRIVFEPFWFLYVGLFLEAIVVGIRRVCRR